MVRCPQDEVYFGDCLCRGDSRDFESSQHIKTGKFGSDRTI